MTRPVSIARIDDVDVAAVSPTALRSASLARSLGYQVQWHVGPLDHAGCDPVLLDALDAGDELWLHGVHHQPRRPHPAGQVVQAIQRLRAAAGHVVRGFSVPFGYVPPASWRESLGALAVSLLAPPAWHDLDELCIDVCSWPGPVLRNLLQVHRRARVASASGQRWGLALHPGRLDRGDEELALRSVMATWQDPAAAPRPGEGR
jgi:hypothetical protein